MEIETQQRMGRENAKRIMQESGLSAMLLSIQKEQLKGRGTFEEYNTTVLLKWGTGYTRRHMWIEIENDTIRFRLPPHRTCAAPEPYCDGEYHVFTRPLWSRHGLLQSELQKYYAKPVAESSDD